MDDKERRDEAFKVIHQEATSFYRLIVTVATTFLGGTLMFSEKFAPNPTKSAIVCMAVGWLLLIASIVMVAFVRRNNVEVGRLLLENRYDEARKEEKVGRKLTTLAGLFLAAGMAGVMLSGVVSFWQNANLENSDGTQSNQSGS